MDFKSTAVPLQDLCLLTVGSYLSPTHVWSIHRLVPYVHCPRIEHIVHSFICDNFMDISHTDQFLALDEKEMQWLLDNQDIKVSEAAMLDSLTRWYKHDERQRENAFKQLFDKMHLSVIGKDVLSAMIKKYQLVKVIPGLRKYKKLFPQRGSLDDLIFQENISNVAVVSISREYIQPRLVFEEPCVAAPPLFEYLPFNTGVIHYWVLFGSQHIEVTLKAFGKDLFASYVVPWKDKLYIFGSTRKRLHCAMLEPITICEDLDTGKFHRCTTPPNILPSQGLCVSSRSYVFIFGGYGYSPCDTNDSSEPLDHMMTQPSQSVYRYDYIKDKWAEMAPSLYKHLDFERWGSEIAVLYKDRYLYVFHSTLSERYNICTNTWSPVESPWGEIQYFQSAHVFNEKIFVFAKTEGDFENSFQCFVYDVVNSLWQHPWSFHPSASMKTQVLFGKTFAVNEAFSEFELRDYLSCYNFSELEFSSGKSGQLMALRKKKLANFKLSSRMNVFEFCVLCRRLRPMTL